MISLLLICAGLLAGFIDAIAGGGGLITLPVLSLVLQAGPVAIGTNKIVGTVAAAVALGVYAKSGHFVWGKSLLFAVWVGLGSWCGSLVAPMLPLPLFKWLILITCPVILWVVWKKDLWVQRQVAEVGVAPGTQSGWAARVSAFEWSVLFSGFFCGFYDGVWGPGGGTFMFLSLLVFAKLPLFTALAAAKFANTASAGVALANYARQGFVHWPEGLMMALGIGMGAFLGASHATKKAAEVVRPVLTFVVVLLLLKVVGSLAGY